LHFVAPCSYNPLCFGPVAGQFRALLIGRNLVGSFILNMETRAVYPGSFDPVTNGHIDLIQRSAALFDRVVVAILRNTEKIPLFTVEERTEMLEEAVRDLKNVSVTSFAGLLVDFVEQQGASVIIRGIRAVSDYEYELQMALMNRRLSNKVETVFMLPAESYSYLSSKLVKEIAQLGGSVHGLVPADVEKRLSNKFQIQ
jgi:pantetheine-phosphate adenylyltransferase